MQTQTVTCALLNITFHTVSLYHRDFITRPDAWHLLYTVFTLVLPPASNLADERLCWDQSLGNGVKYQECDV